MAYDRIAGPRYAIESVDGGPSSFGVLLIVGGLLVTVGGALFAIGPGQYVDARDFMTTLAFVFGGGASLVGGFLLGLQHGGRPTVITQPGELAIDEPGAEDRRVHVDSRSFPIDEVQRIEIQRMRLVHHNVESASTTEHIVYFVAIVLRRNVVELSFRDADEAARHANDLAERLGKPVPETRGRPNPAAIGLLGVAVIVCAIVGLMFTATFGLSFHAREPVEFVRYAAYVAAFTPGTYLLSRGARKLTLRAWVRSVYGMG